MCVELKKVTGLEFISGCTVPLRKAKMSEKERECYKMSTVAMHSLWQICHTEADVYDTLGSRPIRECSLRLLELLADGALLFRRAGESGRH